MYVENFENVGLELGILHLVPVALADLLFVNEQIEANLDPHCSAPALSVFSLKSLLIIGFCHWFLIAEVKVYVRTIMLIFVGANGNF